MTDEELTARAAELAERILEEVTSIDQDWATISALARQLSVLAGAAASAGDTPADGGAA
jgi:predicted MarR family transcription regulator